eukprot:scaffold255217_cov31-Prasinocladus_malaysianus.AAC.1
MCKAVVYRSVVSTVRRHLCRRRGAGETKPYAVRKSRECEASRAVAVWARRHPPPQKCNSRSHTVNVDTSGEDMCLSGVPSVPLRCARTLTR